MKRIVIITYEEAEKLGKHLESLPGKPATGRYTVVIVGGGCTGLEIACNLPNRLKKIAQLSGTSIDEMEVIMVDHSEVGSILGRHSQPMIDKTLHELGITTRNSMHVTSIQADSITLESGEVIHAQTVIWAIGIRANRLTEMFPVEKDKSNRIIVDSNLRIPGIAHCFAAGDVACAMVDETHTSVMSCQHARPQGRIVGHNVLADLFEEPMLTYRQEQFVTTLDLGSSNALYMEGWDRLVMSQGLSAKKTKYDINHKRIYPSLTENANDLFTMAMPIIQSVPDKYSD